MDVQTPCLAVTCDIDHGLWAMRNKVVRSRQAAAPADRVSMVTCATGVRQLIATHPMADTRQLIQYTWTQGQR
jgi:hypothetical protein